MTDHITLPRSVVEHAIEAMRFALHVGFDETSESQMKKGDKAVRQIGATTEALRAALAAQQAEPVATYMGHRLTPDGTKEFWGLADTPLAKGTKLYIAPQPAQPVAVPQDDYWKKRCEELLSAFEGLPDPFAAPTPPAATVSVLEPLTDEELDALALDEDGLPNSHLEFARAVEAAHAAKLAKRGGV